MCYFEIVITGYSNKSDTFAAFFRNIMSNLLAEDLVKMAELENEKKAVKATAVESAIEGFDWESFETDAVSGGREELEKMYNET